MLEKKESIVSVTSSSFSELLDMLRNLDKSGRLLTKQSFVVEVMVLPYSRIVQFYLYGVCTRLDYYLRYHRFAAVFQHH